MDDIILFSSLSAEQIQQIVEIQLSGLVKRLEGRNLRLELSEKLIEGAFREGEPIRVDVDETGHFTFHHVQDRETVAA